MNFRLGLAALAITICVGPTWGQETCCSGQPAFEPGGSMFDRRPIGELSQFEARDRLDPYMIFPPADEAPEVPGIILKLNPVLEEWTQGPGSDAEDRLKESFDTWVDSNVGNGGTIDIAPFAEIAPDVLTIDIIREKALISGLSLAVGETVTRQDLQTLRSRLLDNSPLTPLDRDVLGAIREDSADTSIFEQLTSLSRLGDNQQTVPGSGVNPRPRTPPMGNGGTPPRPGPGTILSYVFIAQNGAAPIDSPPAPQFTAGGWPLFTPRSAATTEPSFPIPSAEAAAEADSSFPAEPFVVPTDEEFIQMLDARFSVEDGLIEIPFFRIGFYDAVLIRTGKSDADICSGTLIRGGYVLTAAHCLEKFAEAGSVHLVPPDSMECLDLQAAGVGPADEKRNIVDICALPRLGIAANWKETLHVNNSDDGLALLRLADPTEAIRYADITAVYDASSANVSITGFGQSSVVGKNGFGPLQIGWASIAMDPPRTFADVRDGIHTLDQYWSTEKNRQGVVCGGDSGGAVFRGRLFGYAGEGRVETHELLGVVGRGAALAHCQLDRPIPTTIFSTQTDEALTWLCEKTDNSLSICGQRQQ